jgi:hypothetical protein
MLSVVKKIKLFIKKNKTEILFLFFFISVFIAAIFFVVGLSGDENIITAKKSLIGFIISVVVVVMFIGHAMNESF